MKNIILVGVLFLVAYMPAQVAIGKNSISNSSVSLEFEASDRGITLPWVNSATDVTGAVNGTLIYDVSDKKVKVKYSSGWKDLSINTTGVVDTSLQDSFTDLSAAKTIIGSNTADTTPGILVLTDTDKVMVLPKLASPHLNIINPSPGMVAYDTLTHQVAIFNGTVWTFWKS